MRGYRGIIVPALVALTVAGCVQTQIADLRKRCDFANDPRFVALRGKIPLSPAEVESPPTLAEISNNARPTTAERAALFEFDQEGAVCARDALNITSRVSTDSIVGLFRETRLAVVNQIKLLADGKITYGQYRANTYQLFARAQQIMGEYERAQQMADAASQQAAAAHLSSAVQALQVFNRQPSITTCNSLGNSVSCMTN